jgi:hypothetical protein
MKIGLLTYHDAVNYGANLQMLCTYKCLQALGHEVFVYDYCHTNDGSARQALHRKFVENHVQLTATCTSEEQLIEVTKVCGLQHIIVGSDAIFDLGATGAKYPNPFWLKWCVDLGISYSVMSASSMGYIYLKERAAVLKDIRDDFKRIKRISVRDLWTKVSIFLLSGRLIPLSYDPTCMIDLIEPLLEDYSLPDELKGRNYIVTTLSAGHCNSEWFAELKNEANRRNILVCALPHPDRPFSDYPTDCKINVLLDPLAWLKIVRSSSGFIGERFHPLTISIYSMKPVLCLDIYARKSDIKGFALMKFRSKAYDILFRAGLRSCHYGIDRYFKDISAVAAIRRLEDYDQVKLKAFGSKSRKKFVTYLEDCLNVSG